VYKPNILEMFELCMSGQVFRIFFLSSLAQIMKAFIGRFICGLPPPAPGAEISAGRCRFSRTIRGPATDRRGVAVVVAPSSLGPGDDGEEDDGDIRGGRPKEDDD
jgi:hypothetical protein